MSAKWGASVRDMYTLRYYAIEPKTGIICLQ